MLEVGNYIKVTGFAVKSDNDIYIVDKQYKEGDYCCLKVKQNGELSTTKYNILFLKEKHFNNSDINIEVINKDDLKTAKKEVNNYINGITAEEKVYSFVDTDKKEVGKGTFIKVIKSIPLTSSIYSVPKNSIYECTAEAKENSNYLFHMLGKRGEKLSIVNANATNKIMLGFRPALVEKLFNEEYIIIVDRIEMKKGEIEKQEIKKELTVITERSEYTEVSKTLNHKITITADIDTRDNSPLWVVKVVDKLDKEEYKKLAGEFKELKGYYSKFKHGFIFKYDPTEVLKGQSEEVKQQEEQQEEPEQTMKDIKANNRDMETKQQEDEQSENPIAEEIDNSFDDILSKFDNIEINNNSRISADDEEFCKGKEKEYKEFIEFSNNYIQYLEVNKFKNPLYNSQCLIDEMETQRQNKMGVFVNSIVNYFGNKYKVTLTSEPIYKKYSIEINYNNIVSEVIEQLGGYNFTDKAEKEIKDKFKNVVNNDKISIKNNKISIDGFFYIDSFDVKYKTYSVSYNSNRDFHKLFKAISHFLYGSNESYFSNLYDTITQKKNDDVFKTHEIANNGIKTLKLFKNGRIDLEFSSSEYARKFVKEYCGYMGKVA